MDNLVTEQSHNGTESQEWCISCNYIITGTNRTTSEDQVVSEPVLPAKPEAPTSSDCCGNGCSVCVFDIYEHELVLWKKECEQIRNGELAGKANTECSTLHTEEYHTFKIIDITKETDTCLKYKFSLPNQQCLQYNPGQHLILRWKSIDKVVTRQYTIISETTAIGYFEVVMKLYPDGCMSQYIRTWSVGDLIEWRGPFGHFTYTPNMQPWVVLLAAGTGIAPMTHVVRTVLDNDQDETRLRLIYVCRTYGEVLLKTQLVTWQDFWNFSVLYVLSQEVPGSGAKKRSSDQIHYGRLDEALLRQELLQLNCEDVKVLICGTKSFNRDMVGSVQRIGLNEKDYFVF